MEEVQNYYIGTDLKFLINFQAEGFNMDNDDYSIVLRCNGRTVEVHKKDIIADRENNHYIMIDSSQFGSGLLQMIVYAEVPDEDFVTTRTEVGVLNLCELRRV